MELNYEDDVRIDPTQLDVEWLGHSELSIKYGKHFAKCSMELELAEERIKVIRSELIKEANDDPEKHLGAGVKPTGPVVEAYYRNHEKHKNCKAEIINLQFEKNVAEVVKDEFSFARKTALENLVKLHGQHYFAGPEIPRDIDQEWLRKQSTLDANKNVRFTSKRKRRT